MKPNTHATYLKELAGKLKLRESEDNSIKTSLETIINKLKDYFKEDGLKEVVQFGSYDRHTLLTRKVDEESDVDILIVFDEKRWVSQTYLNKLKEFAETYYKKSEPYQDFPTITIELAKIKFELVPCIYKEEFLEDDKYLIPNPGNTEFQWIKTEPHSLKNQIQEYTKTRATLIDLILLYKYWNIYHGNLYSTFQVETFLLKHFDFEEDLCYNFYKIIDVLHFDNPEKEQNDLSRKSKEQKEELERHLSNGNYDQALLLLQKIVPSIN